MNKSELELQNIQSIIDEMPVAERALCVSMVSSLMASVGHPVHGRVFMIAVAFTNCQVAVHNIKMGLVNEDGSIPEKFMQGDGRVKAHVEEAINSPITVVAIRPTGEGTLSAKSFVPGGYTGHKTEILAVDECKDSKGDGTVNVTIDSIEEALSSRIKDSKLLAELKSFHSGGYVGDSKLKEGEAEGVVAKPVSMVEIFNREKGIRELVPFDPVEILKDNKPDSFEA